MCRNRYVTTGEPEHEIDLAALFGVAPGTSSLAVNSLQTYRSAGELYALVAFGRTVGRLRIRASGIAGLGRYDAAAVFDARFHPVEPLRDERYVVAVTSSALVIIPSIGTPGIAHMEAFPWGRVVIPEAAGNGFVWAGARSHRAPVMRVAVLAAFVVTLLACSCEPGGDDAGAPDATVLDAHAPDADGGDSNGGPPPALEGVLEVRGSPTAQYCARTADDVVCFAPGRSPEYMVRVGVPASQLAGQGQNVRCWLSPSGHPRCDTRCIDEVVGQPPRDCLRAPNEMGGMLRSALYQMWNCCS